MKEWNAWYLDKKISDKDITLCSIAEGKNLINYNKTVLSYTDILNFNKANLKPGDSYWSNSLYWTIIEY